MPKKEFYSVARGLTIGIFTGWSKCNASVHKYHNAVFKKFDKIDGAINFLLAGNAFQSCSIPVYDDSITPKSTKDFGHVCPGSGSCTISSIDQSPIDLDSVTVNTPNVNSESENKIDNDQVNNTGNVHHNIYNDQVNNIDNVHQTCVKAVDEEQCTQICGLDLNDEMIQCHECNSWTHYLCSKLPVYQLFTLVNSSRRYTCELCAKVTKPFKDKWEAKLSTVPHKKSEAENSEKAELQKEETLEIVKRIENSVVTAITNSHESGEREIINQLRSELQSKNQINQDIKHLDEKVSKFMSESNDALLKVDKNCEKISDTARLTNEFAKLTNALDKVSSSQNKLLDVLKREPKNENKDVESTLEKMTNIVETQNSVTEAFNERLVQVETVAKKLAESQNQLPQMENEDPPRELLRNNRFAPLAENYRSVAEDKDKNHKLLIMGSCEKYSSE